MTKHHLVINIHFKKPFNDLESTLKCIMMREMHYKTMSKLFLFWENILILNISLNMAPKLSKI